MMIALIVAMAENGVIGADGQLAWRISDDLKWFKKNTLGKPIIMGRKTFDSIGQALPDRDNIVVTRNRRYSAPGAFVTDSVSAALSLAEACAAARAAQEICVIGGGEVYAQTLDKADRIYLTRVAASPAGDAYFPAIDSGEWGETAVGSAEKSAKNEHACEFFILERKRSKPFKKL